MKYNKFFIFLAVGFFSFSNFVCAQSTWVNRIEEYYNENGQLVRYSDEYGWENVSHEILKECNTRSEALFYELAFTLLKKSEKCHPPTPFSLEFSRVALRLLSRCPWAEQRLVLVNRSNQHTVSTTFATVHITRPVRIEFKWACKFRRTKIERT